jgi:hypothetical protein
MDLLFSQSYGSPANRESTNSSASASYSPEGFGPRSEAPNTTQNIHVPRSQDIPYSNTTTHLAPRVVNDTNDHWLPTPVGGVAGPALNTPYPVFGRPTLINTNPQTFHQPQPYPPQSSPPQIYSYNPNPNPNPSYYYGSFPTEREDKESSSGSFE